MSSNYLLFIASKSELNINNYNLNKYTKQDFLCCNLYKYDSPNVFNTSISYNNLNMIKYIIDRFNITKKDILSRYNITPFSLKNGTVKKKI